MGSLQEQLLKANLINKKKAKKISREEKLRRKKSKPETQAQRDSDYQRKIAEKIQRDRELNRKLEAEKQRRSLQHRIREIVIRGDVTAKYSGKQRFYFVDRSGAIPWVSLNANGIRDLESGKAAIIAFPEDTGTFRVVTRSTAQFLEKHSRHSVLFFNDQTSR